MDSLNAGYIDSQYRRWKADSNSVSTDWQFFFKGFEFAESKPVALPASPSNLDFAKKQAAVEGNGG